MREKIVIGLSGGVDSAVAARLLQNEGFEVHGIYLQTGSPEGPEDAKRSADYLGVSLKIADVRDDMESLVCAPFADSYLRGETPNPCVFCNAAVKFPALLCHADSIGARFIATGHYAKIQNDGKRCTIMKGKPANDQSYMLCRLEHETLERLKLPLGCFDKRQVRDLAKSLRLPSADKPDSMEICFIPGGDYASYIEARCAGNTPPNGSFIDGSGNVLGTHRGIHRYTRGQRRGLSVSSSKRLYVTDILPDTNEVVLGGADSIYPDSIKAGNVIWCISPVPAEPFEASVKVRHSRHETRAVIYPDGSYVRAEFIERISVTPARGQAAVFYLADALIGSGFII